MGYIFILLTAFLFSTKEIGVKSLSQFHFDPLQINFLVFLIGLTFLAPLAIKEIVTKKLRFTLGDLGYFAICGLISATLATSVLCIALTMTKASVVSVLFSTNVLITPILAAVILKEKITLGNIVSLVFGVVGIVVIFNPVSLFQQSLVGKDLFGMGLGLLSAFLWSIYTVISKKKSHNYNSFVFNFFAFLFGTIGNIIVLILMSKPVFSGVNSENILTLLYVGIFVQFFGYIFYINAIKKTSATMASTVFLIKPALAPILALIYLHESLPMQTIMGISLIVIGAVLGFALKQYKEKKFSFFRLKEEI